MGAEKKNKVHSRDSVMGSFKKLHEAVKYFTSTGDISVPAGKDLKKIIIEVAFKCDENFRNNGFVSKDKSNIN